MHFVPQDSSVPNADLPRTQADARRFHRAWED